MARANEKTWGYLLVTAGLAAAITAGSGLIDELSRESQERHLESCRLAAAVLQDDSPSPYLDRISRTILERTAFDRLHRCLQE